MTVPRDRLLAAVCRGGHIIERFLDPPGPRRVFIGPPELEPPGFVEGSASLGSPEPPSRGLPHYCGQCGARVLQKCASCDAFILGEYRSGAQVFAYNLPASFCWDCGKPYPWATREERIDKLYDQIDYENLDEATLLTVREQIAVLSAPVDEVTDEARVNAGRRIKDIAPKAWEAILPVLQNLLTAEAKRQLGLP